MKPVIKRVGACCGLVLLLASGCVPPPPATDAQLQQSLIALQQMQQQQAQQIEELMQQLARLQPRTDGAMAPQVALEQGNLSGATEEPGSLTAAVSAQTSAEISALTESSALYLQAFGALAMGKLSSAVQGFSDFIAKYPQHEFRGNARYWLAEAFIAQQNDRRAEAVLLEIVESPQEQTRAAAALARLVDIYRSRGATEQARAALQQLARRYPASTELQRFTQDSTLF